MKATNTSAAVTDVHWRCKSPVENACSLEFSAEQLQAPITRLCNPLQLEAEQQEWVSISAKHVEHLDVR